MTIQRLLGILILTFGSVAVAMVAGYFYVVHGVLDSPWDNRAFDPGLWHQSYESVRANNPRGEMYDDLVANHLRVGMHVDEVERLLGTPEYREDRQLLRYNLGSWSGGGVDYDSLDLVFDTAGSMTALRLVRH